MLTIGGDIELHRRYFGSKVRSGVYPVDAWIGITVSKASPAALAKGWDIGSGPTRAMCKNLTLRLKRPGMKWDTDNAAALMNLVAVRESGQWEQY